MTPREVLAKASPRSAWIAVLVALLTAFTAILTAHVSDENVVQWPKGAKCSPAGNCSCYVDIVPSAER